MYKEYSPFVLFVKNQFSDHQALPPALQPLAGETRFLLTSHYSPACLPFVRVLPVPELSPADALALAVRHHRRQDRAAGLLSLASLQKDEAGSPALWRRCAAWLDGRSRHAPPLLPFSI